METSKMDSLTAFSIVYNDHSKIAIACASEDYALMQIFFDDYTNSVVCTRQYSGDKLQKVGLCSRDDWYIVDLT
jgi:hypothetical protein